MNTAEYIASGILEQYVAGTVSPQEKQEVECMSHIYPEIQHEVVALQNAIEAMAMAEEKTPPAFLRNQILNRLKELKEEEETEQVKDSDLPSTESQIKSSESLLSNSETEKPSAKIFNLNYNQLKVAASILLLITAGLGFFLMSNISNSNKLSTELASVQTNLKASTQMLESKNTQLAVLTNNDFKPVILKGIETKSPESAATIYWNKTTQEVYISIASLPTPVEDKQYQLWAIADGKPVDMGMIDPANTKAAFQKMKTIGNAQAFAITLEKKGGVPSPTLTEMYVMGGV